MIEFLKDFFAPDAKVSEENGKLRIVLPDGRFAAFPFAGFEFGNPSAQPMKDSPLLDDFLAKRAGKPDDDPEAA
ncbi:hypothetical protein [Methylobacterium oryzae]|uniref:hypothetical protein n=1 Tax=Methylobacterium oryzae TaxID=334852 RepID=UPI001F219D9B|nr:hypothetical protein [Methylobacterium oryzae]UIN38376.1 hypothetical protein LXM90_30810 [Methylobacterium oryzae]